MRILYEEPNKLKCTTFNWLSEATQVKLSKFPVKCMKKSDEISGVKVTLKDFIKVRNATLRALLNNHFFTILQNSQVLAISEVSPGNDLRDWLQTIGKCFGFISPQVASWTPLVLAKKKKPQEEGKEKTGIMDETSLAL